MSPDSLELCFVIRVQYRAKLSARESGTRLSCSLFYNECVCMQFQDSSLVSVGLLLQMRSSFFYTPEEPPQPDNLGTISYASRRLVLYYTCPKQPCGTCKHDHHHLHLDMKDS